MTARKEVSLNARKPITIRFSDEELEAAKSLAEKHGIEFSEFVRRASTGDLIPESEQYGLLKEIRDEVKKIASRKK